MTLTRRARRRAQAALVVVLVIGVAAVAAVNLGNEPLGFLLAGTCVAIAGWVVTS